MIIAVIIIVVQTLHDSASCDASLYSESDSDNYSYYSAPSFAAALRQLYGRSNVRP